MLLLQPDVSAAQSHGWSWTLHTSDAITIISILVTVAGVVFGIYQMREASRAKTDARKARRLLLRQGVSQHFTGSTGKALKLFTAIHQGRWDECSETAILLYVDLANAAGYPEHLLGKTDKENIAAAVAVMSGLINKLPLSAADQDSSLQTELIQQCQTVLATVNAVEGSLRLRTAFGGEEDEYASASSGKSTTTHKQLDSD